MRATLSSPIWFSPRVRASASPRGEDWTSNVMCTSCFFSNDPSKFRNCPECSGATIIKIFFMPAFMRVFNG